MCPIAIQMISYLKKILNQSGINLLITQMQVNRDEEQQNEGNQIGGFWYPSD